MNGIGTELIKAAERFAREINIPVVFFHVEQSNILAFELYKRLGYSIMKEEGTRFGMIKKSPCQGSTSGY
ncbi:MAG: GNAT family N-acetyltransferase [Lachnospiraceae bacterium]